MTSTKIKARLKRNQRVKGVDDASDGDQKVAKTWLKGFLGGARGVYQKLASEKKGLTSPGEGIECRARFSMQILQVIAIMVSDGD